MTPPTNTPEYWLNWRFLVCAIFLLFYMGFAAFLIWKFEAFNKRKLERMENQREPVCSLYKHEAWKTCLKGIHPNWLLAYRLLAFAALFAFLVGNMVVDGPGIMFYYTQWTFLLVTVYFGLASSFSIYGCYFTHQITYTDTEDQVRFDPERGTYVAPSLGGEMDISNLSKSPSYLRKYHDHDIAGGQNYFLQTVYQTSAGAVVLTDLVFWFIIYPFMTPTEFHPDFFMVTLHSVNAIFLLGETLLNCMRFPMFRFAYFILWTALFVIFQWIIHACVSLGWPYPFLELSSPYAPLWYAAVGLLTIPCYSLFALIVKLKHLWLSRAFPGSCQFVW